MQPCKTYPMTNKGMYGEAVVPRAVFVRLNAEFFISHGDESTKYMCANSQERDHLESLGIAASSVACDWYRIVLDASMDIVGDMVVDLDAPLDALDE